MKKINPLLFIPTLCLASCSKVGYAGTYAFQMGKAGSTNIRLALTLTEQPVVDEKQGVNGKMFTIEANLPNMSASDIAKTLDFDIGVDEEDLTEIISAFVDVLKDNLTFYYNVGTIERAMGTQLKLGALLNAEETGFSIPSELVESIVCAYINDSMVTLQVPVSLNDLQLQLCWYGLYVNFDSTSVDNMIVALKADKLPGLEGEERFGSHPVIEKDEKGNITKNEVDVMNLNFAKEFSNTPVYESSSSSKVIGFIAKLPDNHMYFYKDNETVISGANLAAAVNQENEYGIFDNKTDINLIIDTSDGVDKECFKIIEINDSTSATKLEEEKFYQKPFVFRDFHDIKIGLARE